MELLTVEELSKYLKLNPNHIYRLKAAHKIPFIQIGGAVRFNKADIEKWLSEQTGGINEN